MSFDVVRDSGIEATWRLDYHGRQLLAGLSPAQLNWDAGVRADAAGVDTSGPAGLDVVAASHAEAALVAQRWFEERAASSG